MVQLKDLEGVEVSVDVDGLFGSDGRRLFGTVTEVMDNDGKHGIILLVQDAEPNWTVEEIAEEVDEELRILNQNNRELADQRFALMEELVRVNGVLGQIAGMPIPSDASDIVHRALIETHRFIRGFQRKMRAL